MGAHPWLEPFVALVLRGLVTRAPVAFVARELLGRGGCFRYELRQFPGREVMVRHGTGDVVTLGEVFHRPDYCPPGPVAAVLGRNGPRRIVDLGANVGYAGAYFSGLWPASNIEAWEPDPTNAVIHELLIADDRREGRWELHRAAAGTQAGEAKFIWGDVALSKLESLSHSGAGDESTVTVRVDDVLPSVAAADLVKMDIEGGEWEIIADDRFAANPPRCMVMEYHPEGCPTGDPATAVREFLEASGLTVGDVGVTPHGAGMVWAWRER